MTGHGGYSAAERLGDDSPLSAAGLNGPPDRRAVSKRWLTGTILTGVTSCTLMGLAFTAAFNEPSQAARTAVSSALPAAVAPSDPAAERSKGARLFNTFEIRQESDRRRLSVPTSIQDGDTARVRTLPLIHVRMPLAANYAVDASYPAFNPLTIFSEGAAPAGVNTGLIYGASIEGEIELKTTDFAPNAMPSGQSLELSDEEVESLVRQQIAHLTDGTTEIAAIRSLDPNRFGDGALDPSVAAALGVRITPENVSVAAAPDTDDQRFVERVLTIEESATIEEALASGGIVGASASNIAAALSTLLNGSEMKVGYRLRVAAYAEGDKIDVRRATIYDDTRHLLTVAVDDRNQYVPAAEPEAVDIVFADDDDDRPVIDSRGGASNMSVYDAIYRAALAYNMSPAMAGRVVRMLASDVDMRSPVGPLDSLDVLFTDPDENGAATEQSAVLYVRASLGQNDREFFRFEADDGSIDFFNGEGRSARQFLLRNPVPNGVFRSGYGMRRHPILRYSRMHWGVDWSAPRGTPIIAPGNGVVEKAGWAQGYGKQTVIRHANGYETSYSHQSNFAKGIQPGARVRQGQVIGYIGTTGLSTGPHLHYEMKVNGSHVDPMRVRLPTGKTLEGTQLARFLSERDRILGLIDSANEDSLVQLSEAR